MLLISFDVYRILKANDLLIINKQQAGLYVCGQFSEKSPQYIMALAADSLILSLLT